MSRAGSPSRSHSDVLVIGAGSAGSVVAERLSSDPACSVTVLEAGPGPGVAGVRARTDNALVLPVGSASPLVARFSSTLTHDPRRSVDLVRGATVGGSGAVNGGYFCRAVSGDIADWDLPGWGWGVVLAHYRAIETDLDFGGPAHGDHGPIPIRRTAEFTGSSAVFLNACADRGYPWLPDLNGSVDAALPTGVGAVPLNIVDGRRVGPGAAFLVPALGRPNLKLVTDRRVWRIRFERGRAVAVDTHGPDGAGTWSADRIVLCAGAIGSAQLLMLSGLGDESGLRAAGVPVLHPLPVGVHCADHPEWVLPTNWAEQTRRPVLEAVLSLAEGVEVRPYTGGFGAMIGDRGPGRPDHLHVGVAVMKPRSRATITIVSADPGVPPSIDHRYDSAPADLESLRYGLQVVRELLCPTTTVGDPVWSTSQHLCGTAPMGRDGDERAVLDERCRVRGVEGLWVIDGSAMPSIPSRGPHATTVMLAHRAAEFVGSTPVRAPADAPAPGR